MRTGRPKREIKMSHEEREQLESWANAHSLPQGIAARMKIVLLAAQGMNSNAIARRLEVSQASVGKWRRRFGSTNPSSAEGGGA